MKFLADENIAISTIKLFVNRGHDVIDVKSIKRRLSDIEVIKLASQEKRIILTHDKDFVVFWKELGSKYKFKFILIRLIPQTKENLVKNVNFILDKKLWEKMKSFAIVETIQDDLRVYKK